MAQGQHREARRHLVVGQGARIGLDRRHQELELLTPAGLEPVERLRAAMAGVADAFGPADRGRTRDRLRTDLLLVTRDHTRDITHTRDIGKVYKRDVEVSGTD